MQYKQIVFKMYIVILFSIFFGKDIVNNNYEILAILNENSGWELSETLSDSIYISTKNIEGSEFSAIKVQQSINISPDVLKDIIMDVDKYHTFVSNPELFQSKIVDYSDNSLIAYQRIIVDIPLFDDREYYFEMSSLPFQSKDSTMICFWKLLEPENNNPILKRDISATYLEKGAGIWKWEHTQSEKIVISYILYMHPGGYIPNFLIDIINKQSIVGLFVDVLEEVNVRMNK